MTTILKDGQQVAVKIRGITSTIIIDGTIIQSDGIGVLIEDKIGHREFIPWQAIIKVSLQNI